MRILVLGASGFIGRRVVAALLANGHVVVPAGRQLAVLKRLFPACEVVQADLRLAAGRWGVQPLHVDDAVRAIVQLLLAETMLASLNLVGPDPMTTDELTAILRSWLGLPARPWATLRLPLLRAAAWVGDHLPGSMLTQDSLAMLRAGNTASAEPMLAKLGWLARPLYAVLVAEPSTKGDLWLARLTPVRPVLVGTLCLVCVTTGVASALLPAATDNSLLAGLGLTGWPARGVTLAGAALDVVLGLTLLFSKLRVLGAIAQLGVMAIYTVLATIVLAKLWADPFGPLLKNLTVGAATLALLAMEG